MLADLLNKLHTVISGIPKLELSNLLVPLGISFFTFKLLHYLIDAWWGKKPRGSYVDFLAYMLFFQILPSGPVERWPNFLNQSRELAGFRWTYVTEGAYRILIGLCKKLVLADLLAIYAGGLQVQGQTTIGYWLAAYAYALQIYFDFSGYSDIAIGSGRLFGYRIAENFNNPYFKRNISLFWKNWHMSLTSWFRDYIFIPLGGSRVPFYRIVLNTFIMMMVTGLWHGDCIMEWD